MTNVLHCKNGLLRSLNNTNVVISLECFEFLLPCFDLVCQRGHNLRDLRYFEKVKGHAAHSDLPRPYLFVVPERPP